jgi:intracellular sulfur oxidation DsrE/DsrF family protein
MQSLVPGSDHLVAREADFPPNVLDTLVRGAGDIRQVWEAFSFRPGVFNNLKNALNGLEFGYGCERARLSLIFAPHGPSSAFNYNDHIWETYRIGEALDLRDAKGNRVTSNLYVKPNAALSGSSDLDDERGSYQDMSIQTLQERGVIFLACATALQEQARIVRDAGFAPPGMSATDIASDMLSNLIPGVHLVPSMVATIALLQLNHGYSYITIAF